MSRLRITFVLPYAGLAGGIRGIAQYATRLKQRGHQVIIVSTPPQHRSLFSWASVFARGQARAARLFGPSHLDQIDVTHKIINRLRPIRNGDVPDADVVVATWWLTANWVAQLAPRKGAKAYFMQDYGVEDQEWERLKPTWTLPMHLMTISPWLVDRIRLECGEIPISLIPYAADTTVFHALPRAKQTQPTVGFTYRTARSKGTDLAIEAIQRTRQRIPDLRVVSYGPDRPIPSLPLPPDTTYAYCADDERIRRCYTQCDAWLFCSRSEGFGLPILEAMACRTPVIGTRAGAAPTLLANGAGILVYPDAPQEMANAILKVCQLSSAEWQAISDQAHRKALAYTMDDATSLFENALFTAIERRRQGDNERQSIRWREA